MMERKERKDGEGTLASFVSGALSIFSETTGTKEDSLPPRQTNAYGSYRCTRARNMEFTPTVDRGQ
jgi:hypothetical protein